MLAQFDAVSIIHFHDGSLDSSTWPEDDQFLAPGAWCWIYANHRYNTLLWNEEDKARRVDVGPAEIAASKRLIDRNNQRRNDAVEAIDEAILAALAPVATLETARLSSETAGAMIDRMSILSLKIFHMDAQTRRPDASDDHVAACRSKLARLTAQRHDLACCLDQLLAEARQGRAYFKAYHQFKMYDDPSLNPWLYGASMPAP